MSDQHITDSTLRTVFRSVERKLYPTAAQEATLDRFRRVCSSVYNRALEQRKKAYRRRGESLTLYDQQKVLTQQRAGMPSIRAVPVDFLRDALRRLDKGFKAFFRRCKTNAKHKGFPRFRAGQRYKSMEYQVPWNYFRSGAVHVPGIGLVRSRGPDANGKLPLLRVIKRADAWYVQTLITVPVTPPVKLRTSVGIDMGLLSFATLSSGDRIDNPRFLRKSEQQLKKAGREVSRKQKGSKNRRKAVKRLARVHERIAAQRKDFAHQESRKIVNRFDLIGLEALNIRGLARTRLAKSIMDAAWGLFLFFLLYKAIQAGKRAVAVDPRGTSQECPNCGKIQQKSLSERRHECACGLVLDRDHASSLVIEARALAVAGVFLRRDSPLAAVTRPPPSEPDETGSPSSLR